MSWKRFFREVECGAESVRRRARRAAVERHRELTRQAREREKARAEQDRAARAQYLRSKREEQEAAKAAERQQAADEAALFDNYLDVLTSVHKDLVLDTDWVATASAPPPAPPLREATNEIKAREALAAYKPGLIARMSGSARRIRESLEKTIDDAKATDASLHQAATARHQAEAQQHTTLVELAQGVLRRDPSSLREAAHALLELDDLTDLGVEVRVDAIESDAVALTCAVRDDEIVPSEEVKVSASGKLTTKKWAESKYWSLYQDFVCGCALRLAREALGLLPISRVVVNVSTHMLNTSTGHVEPTTILAAHFTRSALATINVAGVDASDSLSNFNWRMKFKKTAGFEPVDAISLAENWLQ